MNKFRISAMTLAEFWYKGYGKHQCSSSKGPNSLIKVCSIGIGWGIKENLVTQHHLLKRCVTILSECTTMCSLTVFVPGGEESL